MNNGVTHDMEMVQVYPSGAQEWRCPTCGRRFIMQWPPHYKRIILEEGDIEAAHTGLTRSPESMNDFQLPADQPVEHTEELNAEDQTLAPWAKWMNNHSI